MVSWWRHGPDPLRGVVAERPRHGGRRRHRGDPQPRRPAGRRPRRRRFGCAWSTPFRPWPRRSPRPPTSARSRSACTGASRRWWSPRAEAAAFVPPVPPPPPAGATGPAPDDEDDRGTARVTLRLPDPLKAQAEQQAAREGLSVNAWLVRLVATALRAGPRPAPRSPHPHRPRPPPHRLRPRLTPRRPDAPHRPHQRHRRLRLRRRPRARGRPASTCSSTAVPCASRSPTSPRSSVDITGKRDGGPDRPLVRRPRRVVIEPLRRFGRHPHLDIRSPASRSARSCGPPPPPPRSPSSR